ncbi:hypothetical protein OV320_1624 [Actinobacteria bacterium OV320]|nr:hypothetical protein OV320_1624 [Actinobacteria bacterium OV320]
MSECAALGRNKVREVGPRCHDGYFGDAMSAGIGGGADLRSPFAAMAGSVMTNPPQRLRATMSP